MRSSAPLAASCAASASHELGQQRLQRHRGAGLGFAALQARVAHHVVEQRAHALAGAAHQLEVVARIVGQAGAVVVFHQADELHHGVQGFAQVVRADAHELQQAFVGQLEFFGRLLQLGVALAQIGQRFGQVQAVGGGHLLERIVGLLEPQLGAHARLHDGGADRFGDEVGRAFFQPGLLELGLGLAGDEDHRDVGEPGVALDGFEHLEARHAGHLGVEQHQVGWRLGHQPQGVQTLRGKAQPAQRPDHAGQRLHHAGIVVHDQDVGEPLGMRHDVVRGGVLRDGGCHGGGSFGRSGPRWRLRNPDRRAGGSRVRRV